jgi:hypothetical protein
MKELTDSEKQILNMLCAAHNLYLSLETYHPAGAPEWVTHVHALQNMIATRVVYRTNPEVFPRKNEREFVENANSFVKE